ncbi:hypothetical protein MSG28_003626 [Choristoneura fumiferana]|uniref:Uncharacterized protein n=1 Tax=Choristoneura fumiferana TaxID=7141 RepID=A0ACC0KGF2_CHOFU|nr:hypothetical protein MSG28_003626 [Choristoneura fumiferana]
MNRRSFEAVPQNAAIRVACGAAGAATAAAGQSLRRQPSDHAAAARAERSILKNPWSSHDCPRLRPAPPFIRPGRGMASVRTRSASPKSVSFSPVLERKYSIDRVPANPPELKSQDWRKYFNDFSAYLGCFYCAALRYIGCVLVDRSGTGLNKQTLRNRS